MALPPCRHPVGHLVRDPALTIRKTYLDWLRGAAVVIMVEAHVVDAWTPEADRHDWSYFNAVFVAGLAAPLFLFLAGVSLALAASARADTERPTVAAAAARMRGAQVFVLAFLFRLQSQLLGWGALVNFLKVDILNVMGLAMIAAGALWGIAEARRSRIVLFAMAVGVVAMTTPIIREAAWVAALPDPIEWYIRPAPGRTTFTLFPWAAFLFAGVIVGDLAAAAKSRAQDLVLQGALLAAGAGGVGLAYWASFQPSIYPVSNFWTSSPTFFFIRLGIATAFVPIAWILAQLPRLPERWRSSIAAPPVMVTLGRSSLFVYWIHVEMVYGFLGRPFRRGLPLQGALLATAALCLGLYAIVLWKNRVMSGIRLEGPWRILAPIVK